MKPFSLSASVVLLGCLFSAPASAQFYMDLVGFDGEDVALIEYGMEEEACKEVLAAEASADEEGLELELETCTPVMDRTPEYCVLHAPDGSLEWLSARSCRSKKKGARFKKQPDDSQVVQHIDWEKGPRMTLKSGNRGLLVRGTPPGAKVPPDDDDDDDECSVWDLGLMHWNAAGVAGPARTPDGKTVVVGWAGAAEDKDGDCQLVAELRRLPVEELARAPRYERPCISFHAGLPTAGKARHKTAEDRLREEAEHELVVRLKGPMRKRFDANTVLFKPGFAGEAEALKDEWGEGEFSIDGPDMQEFELGPLKAVPAPTTQECPLAFVTSADNVQLVVDEERERRAEAAAEKRRAKEAYERQEWFLGDNAGVRRQGPGWWSANGSSHLFFRDVNILKHDPERSDVATGPAYKETRAYRQGVVHDLCGRKEQRFVVEEAEHPNLRRSIRRWLGSVGTHDEWKALFPSLRPAKARAGFEHLARRAVVELLSDDEASPRRVEPYAADGVLYFDVEGDGSYRLRFFVEEGKVRTRVGSRRWDPDEYGGQLMVSATWSESGEQIAWQLTHHRETGEPYGAMPSERLVVTPASPARVRVVAPRELRSLRGETCEKIYAARLGPVALGEAIAKRTQTVVYASKKHRASAQKIARLLEAKVEPLTWKSRYDVVVAVGAPTPESVRKRQR
jgi:hypothetical protein